jgi:hypothetical protein
VLLLRPARWGKGKPVAAYSMFTATLAGCGSGAEERQYATAKRVDRRPPQLTWVPHDEESRRAAQLSSTSLVIMLDNVHLSSYLVLLEMLNCC